MKKKYLKSKLTVAGQEFRLVELSERKMPDKLNVKILEFKSKCSRCKDTYRLAVTEDTLESNLRNPGFNLLCLACRGVSVERQIRRQGHYVSWI